MARSDRGLHWSEVRVGAVLIVALLVCGIGVLMVGRLLNLFTSRYTLVTLAPSAAGLPQGAAVTLAGQPVGQVAGIAFIPVGRKTRGNNILIRLAIARAVEPQIRRDSRARMRTQGLLGDKYIDIIPGSPHAPPLQPGDTLPLEPGTDFDLVLLHAGQLLDSSRVVVGKLTSLARRIDAGQGTLGRLVASDSLYDAMSATMQELHGTLALLDSPDGSMGRMLRDPTLYDRLVAAVSRVDSLGARIAGGQGTLGKLLNDDALYDRMVSGIGRADSAAAGLAALTRQLDSGNGSLQRMIRDPALYDQFLKAVVDLQTLIDRARQDPRAFVPKIDVKVF